MIDLDFAQEFLNSFLAQQEKKNKPRAPMSDLASMARPSRAEEIDWGRMISLEASQKINASAYPGEAVLHVLEGEVEMVRNGRPECEVAGRTIPLTAQKRWVVTARKPSKLLLFYDEQQPAFGRGGHCFL